MVHLIDPVSQTHKYVLTITFSNAYYILQNDDVDRDRRVRWEER